MKLTQPLVFEPYFRPQVWGQRRLERTLGKRLPATGDFGESWEISAHPHHVSRVAEGPQQGMLLTDLCQQHSEDLYGRDRMVPPAFPLLIKYLDCHVPLSVQVHPTDEIARRLLGNESGKTEAWVVLEAEPSARIYAGLRPGTTREELKQHLERGTVAECLHSFVPQAGDCIFLRAGTVHAVGDGVLMAEVQQTSDATFRLFDWNRPGPDGKLRKLHIAESLESIDWSAGPVRPVVEQENGLLVRCPYFELTRYRVDNSRSLPLTTELSIWLVLDGEAALHSQSGDYRRTFQKGDTVLVPAAARGLSWQTADRAVLLGVRIN